MKCEEFDSKLEAYHDRELSADETADMNSHLTRCTKCEGTVASRKAFSGQVRQALDFQPPTALQDGLRNVLAAADRSELASSSRVVPLADTSERQGRGRGKPWYLSPPVGLAAAAAITFALVAWWLGFRPDPGRHSEPFSRPGNVMILRFAPEPGQTEAVETGGLILANHL